MEDPVSDMPSASAMAFMVIAVPIGLQWPTEGAESATRAIISSSSISPAARARRERQSTVPEPTRSLPTQPSSIGPLDSTMAGRFAVAAAISAAGVVLSQPVVKITPSSG